MLKAVKLLPLFLTLLPFFCWGQDQEEHQVPKAGPKETELEIGGGFTQLGFYLHLDYGQKVGKKMVVKGSLAMELAKSNQMEFTSYFFKPGICYLLNSPEQTLHVSLAAGLIGMYASFKDSKNIQADAKTNGLNGGAFIGPELDIPLSNTILVNGHFHQAYLPLDFLGTAMYFVGGGIKFKF